MLSLPSAAEPFFMSLSVAFTRPTFQRILPLGASLGCPGDCREVSLHLAQVGPAGPGSLLYRPEELNVAEGTPAQDAARSGSAAHGCSDSLVSRKKIRVFGRWRLRLPRVGTILSPLQPSRYAGQPVPRRRQSVCQATEANKTNGTAASEGLKTAGPQGHRNRRQSHCRHRPLVWRIGPTRRVDQRYWALVQGRQGIGASAVGLRP